MKPRLSTTKRSLKRKLILPLFLIVFFLLILGFGYLRQVEFDFNFWPGRQKMASPLPWATQKSQLEEIFAQSGLVAEELTIDETEATAKIAGVEVLFSLTKEIKRQVVSLQFILSRAKIEGRLPTRVDLRFTKPVVSY